MNKVICTLGAVALFSSLSINAEQFYGFRNISANYAKYSEGTKERRGPKLNDFAYIELEGGAGFDWGEVYGFVDLENVEDGAQKMRTAIKGSATYKTGLGELRLYADTFGVNGKFFASRSNVFGVQYNFAGDSWNFNPFVGVHHVNDTSYTGFNGGQFGWTAMYRFNLGEQKLVLGNWHEMDFGRTEEYTSGPETDELSMNGAIKLHWNINEDFGLNVGYRYAFNKLGFRGNTNAILIGAKYNF